MFSFPISIPISAKAFAALGVSEDAAKKRVTRALDKLRDFFAGRGVTLSATTFPLLTSSAIGPGFWLTRSAVRLANP